MTNIIKKYLTPSDMNHKISTTEPNMIVEIQIWKIDADIPI